MENKILPEIIFDKGPNFLLNYLFHSNDMVKTNNNEELYSYYTSLLRLRHDCLHYFVLKTLNLPWKEEEPVNRLLKLDDDNPILFRTPDIVFFDDKTKFWLFIDVSVTYDIATTYAKKYEKYQPIVLYLKNKYVIDSVFIHINVMSNISNLETEIRKIESYQKNDFEFSIYQNCLDIIEQKKQWVSNHIDKEFFDLKKSIDFLKMSNVEQIGKYNDLSVEKDIFDNFNKSFNHLSHIENTVSEYDEGILIDTLKSILDDETDPIFQKFMDKKCDKEQFDNAVNEIKFNNEKRKKRDPKPSIHFFLPKFEIIEELPTQSGQFAEQKMINNFFDFLNKNNLGNFDLKHLFIFEIAEKFEQIMNKSKNKDLFTKIFNGDYPILYGQNTLDLHRKLKRITQYIYCYEKKKQMPQRLKDYFSINKENRQIIYDSCLKEFSEYQLLGFKMESYSRENSSYVDFLRENNLLIKDSNEKEIGYVIKQKIVHSNQSNWSTNFKAIWSKTGINIEKNTPIINKWNVDETIEYDNYQQIDYYVKQLCDNHTIANFKEVEYLNYYETFDHPMASNIKKNMVDQYMPVFEKLMKTNSYLALRNAKDISQQLIHFSLLNMKNGSFGFFNIGIPNCLFIVAGCYNKVFSENGKPFMCVAITKDVDYYKSVFGKVYITPILKTNYFLVVSNWRRLPTFKLTHLHDAFYSVVSSTMNSFLSSTNLEATLLPGKYEHIFAIRTLISLCTNQKCAEILMDARYAYMSAFATHTNIGKLLIEKFGPPYTCVFEVWLINRLLTRLPLLNNYANSSGIKLKTPEFSFGKRIKESLGGEIYLPAVWGDYLLIDIHEVLDETFIYVHTMKEPSNIFHENVKALDTIINFQLKFNELEEKYKTGSLLTKKDFRDYLLKDTQIGFSSGVIYHSVEHTLSMEKPNIKKIVHEINDESISELISTKAVISDVDRVVMEDTNVPKRFIAKQIKKIQQYQAKELTTVEKENLKFYYLKTKSKYYNERKSRQKVIETILDKIEDNKNINTTVDLANYFIKTENGKVVADICIKSQYGSKREFYVINIGAKALARCTELFFRKLSENSPNEAISIAGDNKILTMQKMLDKIYLNPNIKPNMKLKYVNGDCTKWSAAETMGSFLSMCYSLKNRIPQNMYNVLIATFNAWSKKKIQIPIDIYNKVVVPQKKEYYALKDKLSFLVEAKNNENSYIDSTQNFLQGMFNYSSSYKAVCCLNYTKKIWSRIYPNSTLISEHLEHSDDYALLILYEDENEFEKFRVLQKIMMRLHGYNDSDRKTNSQNFFMEFVSQLSFNGVMLYPQIKKSKEVNISLPCTGYKTDCDAAISRVGECMRVGCNQTFLYFFQRWHMICLTTAYSLLPGMYNNMYPFDKMLNQPVEMFGIPDMLPVFSLFCKGNGNNYRLFTYGDINARIQIIVLFELAKNVFQKEGYLSEDPDYTYSLFNPKYLYELSNKNILNLRRNIKWSPVDLQKFWEDHAAYRFLKPKNREMLISWIKSMFYNRTFSEAYVKSTRTKMMMRISNFIKNRILKTFIPPNEIDKPTTLLSENVYTIKEIHNYIETMINNKKEYAINRLVDTKENYDYKTQLLKITTKCDPTYSAIYSVLGTLIISHKRMKKLNIMQISMKTPPKISTMPILNSPETIIQYLYNFDDFIEDKRHVISETSLAEDIKNIRDRIPAKILSSKNPMDILSVYNDLSISKSKSIVMIGYNRYSRQLVDVIIDIFSNNLYPHVQCYVSIEKMLTVIDPFTQKTMYTRGHKTSIDTHQQSIENLTLWYTYCLIKKRMSIREINNFFSSFIFTIDAEKNEYCDYKSILNTFTEPYIDRFNIDEHIIKCAAYLKAELLGDVSLLKVLTNRVYTYSYRWETISNFIGNKYMGPSSGYFSHYNKTNKFIQFDENKPILLLTPKLGDKVFFIQYNIVLKIYNKITEFDQSKLTSTSNVHEVKLPFDSKQAFFDFCHNERIITIYKYKNNELLPINYKDYDNDEKYLPILKTQHTYNKGTEIKMDLTKYVGSIKRDYLTVFVGKEKIYTLPFWLCRQHNNLEVVGFKNNSQIPIDKLLKNNNLFNYLTFKEIIRIFDDKELITKDVVDSTLKSIFKNKIYNHFKGDVLDYICDSRNKTMFDNNLNHILTSHPNEKEKTLSIVQPHYFTEELENKKTGKEEISKPMTLSKEELSVLSKFEPKVDFLVDVENDFLFEYDEETMGDKADEVGFYEKEEDFPKENLSYLSKGKLENISGNFQQLTIKDIIVERPHQKKQFSKKTQLDMRKSFILKRLNNLPDFEFLYDHSFLMDNKKKNYNIIEHLLILRQYIDYYYNYKDREIGIEMHIVLHTLYDLLCNFYIHKFDSSILKYDFYDDNLNVYINKTLTNMTKQQFEKTMTSNNVFHKIVLNDNTINCDIKVALYVFIGEYKKVYGYQNYFFCKQQFIEVLTNINKTTQFDEFSEFI